jgi:hypothetical protein
MPSDRYIPSAEAMTGDYLPEPPPDWPECLQARLRAIVGAHPFGWWSAANEPLLHEYVRALDMAERLQAMLDALDVQTCPVAELQGLLQARDRESKRALSLARTMRLTQQSVAPSTASRALERGASADAPWIVPADSEN